MFESDTYMTFHRCEEREGCHGDMSHVRTTPKRMVGVGKIESLAKEDDREKKNEENQMAEERTKAGTDFFACETVPSDQPQASEDEGKERESSPVTTTTAPKSWAMLVNPTASAATPPQAGNGEPDRKLLEQAMHVTFSSVTLSGKDNGDMGGQFSDADDSDYSSSGGSYADSDKDISDEECDVYVLDPEDVDARTHAMDTEQSLNDELLSDFPTLTASLQVPYEGSDNEGDGNDMPKISPAVLSKQEAEKKKEEALKPVTNSGKLYNSFRGYGELMKPKAQKKSQVTMEEFVEETPQEVSDDYSGEEQKQADRRKDGQSRIIGGMTVAGQGTEVEDDGEGWIMSPADIQKMKSAGRLNPSQNPCDLDDNADAKAQSGTPPMSQRAACTTTDFAMQNVILQMNLELLSVDGIRVRRLKSWVARCGACFAVFADGENVGPNNTKRLFCSRCGSDMMQRVAASVDAKTGRLRLHLSKKYKNNLRGTKFSLPKPGTGNRFQGDLLLREDQLLMGAWNQKVKQRSGGKARRAAQSIFGSDLASTVGCHANSVKSDDIRVGFGRRNPNATTHGRERRGKKKKSSDKACGLRRY